MKTKMKIFNVVFGLAICVLPGLARAAGDCTYFSPALALCSVHSYNIGDATNPTSGARTAQMNEVIALKSTVIAQQLKEQYDVLNAVIKRFKTQLEKAVLTSKIEVLTGNSSSASGASSSSSNNNGLSNAEDCYSVSKENAYDCVARNLTKISAAAENDITNARKQLNNENDIMGGYSMCGESKNCISVTCDGKTNANDMNKSAIQTCIKKLQLKVRDAKDKFEQDNAKARWGYR